MCCINEPDLFIKDAINSMHFISNILKPFLQQLNDEERQAGWFQQDGAMAHAARVSMQGVQKVFGTHIFSCVPWPPQSPKYFHLLRKLKGVVYGNNPCTIEQLKHNIRAAIQSMQHKKLDRVFTNMQRGVELCL